jgi:TRAP transporter TAXI family solute receptor
MFKTLITATFAAGLLAGPAFAQDKSPIEVTVTGASASGYFRVLVESMNGILRDAYPGSAVTFKPGSVAGGMVEVAAGKADISIAAGSPEIDAAMKGEAPFKESVKGKLFGVMYLHEKQVVHLLMLKSWADENGIKTWEDIAAKKPKMRMTFGYDSCPSCTVAQPYAIFKEYGFEWQDIEKWGGAVVRTNGGDGLKFLADGKVDAYVFGRLLPDSTVTETHRARPLLWIDGDPKKIEAAAKAWGYNLLTVKKGTYDFIDKDTYTMIQWSPVMAGSSTSADTVYKFLKGLYDNKERVRAIHPSMVDFAPEEGVKIKDHIPLHPGAEKYYREVGVLK